MAEEEKPYEYTHCAGAYCPEHIPEWVAGWRKRRDERKS